MSEQEPKRDDAISQAFSAFRTGSAGLGAIDPNERPSGAAMLRAMGGARGLVESLLPGVVFLVLYTLTREVWLAILVPLVLSIGFVLARVLVRGQSALAFAGLIGVGISAAIALLSGRAEDNFLWGFTVNTVVVLVLLISLLARRPLIGCIVGGLTGRPHAWRTEPGRRAIAVRATLLWLLVIGSRLAVQVPLYFAGNVEALAATKLIMGIPLYAAAIWVTWLLVRTVPESEEGHAESGS